MEKESSQRKKQKVDHIMHVGILGATGMVGQKFIQLLENHPHFVVKALGASEKSAGKKYREVVSWKQTTPIPSNIGEIVLSNCDPKEFNGCSVIFSGLDSSVAGSIEEEFAKADFAVFSNAKNHRMDVDVPILIPFVNPEHIHVIPHQRKSQNYNKGFIVTNANCSSTGLVIVLKPLQEKFGIKNVVVFTMQALSGSGYPGVPSMDICDNIIPYIKDEEEKLATEPQKILGTIKKEDGSFVYSPIRITAHCNRVNVTDGHTACVSIEFVKKPTIEEVKETLSSYSSKTELTSSPKKVIVLMDEEDRPQPRLDRNNFGGYAVTVGRVRPCNIFDVRLTLLSHNTVIGAAGGSILNAELAKEKNYIS